MNNIKTKSEEQTLSVVLHFFCFDFVTESKVRVFLYVTDKWDGVLADRVRVISPGYSEH